MAAVLLLPTNARADPVQDSVDEAPGATILWHQAPALFPVRVVVPEGYDPERTYPAVFALHGFGSSSELFERVAPPFTRAGYVVVIPEAPYPVPLKDAGRRSSWFLTTWTQPPLAQEPEAEFRSVGLTTFEFLPGALAAVEEQFRIGPVYVFGFSLGGVQALAAGFYHRDRFAGIVAAGVRGFDREWFTFKGETLEAGSELPVLLLQGRTDPLVPFSEAERARDELRAAGYEVTLYEFPGAHEVPEEQLERIVAWLGKLREP